MNSTLKIILKSTLLIVPGILLFVFLASDFTQEKNFSSLFRPKSKNTIVFKSPESTKKEVASPFSNYLEPVEAVPVRLIAPAQSIDVEIIEVGVTAEGALEAPEDWSKAGWYTKSAFPGHKGNLIIDGHYDTSTGGAAAFWNLKNLKVSDKVVVADEFGVEHTYVVKELIHVSISDTDRLDKLNKHSGRTLTLITCGGFWNPIVGTYDERLIIKAEIEDKRQAKDSS